MPTFGSISSALTISGQAGTVFPSGDSTPKVATSRLSIAGILGTTTMGYRMLASGSVVALAFQFNATIVVTPGTMTVRVLKGNTALLSKEVTISSTGNQGDSVTASSGTHAFAAGDVLSVEMVFGTFVGTVTDSIAYFLVD